MSITYQNKTNGGEGQVFVKGYLPSLLIILLDFNSYIDLVHSLAHLLDLNFPQVAADLT